ncbi:hypothetical protein [Oribacterium sp. P6A1]|uniref:hypothetical protein n=1 Tax=Oribacterium sp. P6A1 TaxID=1410612 RepID=UPI00055CC0AB|nr:hypothetical protein [Oribacterium sp. P6A1]
MKRYRIANKRSKNKSVATLLYDEDKQEFKIEIPKEQDERKLPMLLRASVSKGEYVMNPKFSLLWVRNRLVPSERQNIGQFLKSYGLNNYREDLILEKTEGRSIQDDFVVIREQ